MVLKVLTPGVACCRVPKHQILWVVLPVILLLNLYIEDLANPLINLSVTSEDLRPTDIKSFESAC
jgi:hypothetical protein